ncbi:hypothetical protein N7492_009778 [Penicillium capsulatum]|uniref:DDE-1 domain-containing protein n=1 Tax=Penicillium capsulatum TaxID=69766 RepID=A0A9W9LFE5_9EURO|nr:hypothetical protein N7492_009778 [Penicillium capsulatum]KAJ6114140.1 hypothetical protein N7512_007585 [Penicillium capsulatum]
MPVKQAEITRAALVIPQATDATATSMGPHWTRGFLRRHPQYRRRRRRALDIERQRAADKKVVSKWFESYQATIESYGIQPNDIYNFDETGFQIGVERDQYIITREPKKKIVSGSVTNHESVTVVEAVSATGYTTPPLIILNAKIVLYRWFEPLYNDEVVAVTGSGYINDSLAYQWAQRFEKITRAHTQGAYRMLICDRYGSHMTHSKLVFRLTGLWPVDSSQIIVDLPDYNNDPIPSWSTPANSSYSGSSVYKTPTTAERFRKVENKLNSVTFNVKLISELSKGGAAAWYEAQQLRREIEATTAARLARDGRYNASRTGIRINAITSAEKLSKMKRITQKGENLAALWKLRPK